jgi:ArsR family transcriptional regulator, arsenate/arsenite/antimonite-responsive transcriptional repressor
MQLVRIYQCLCDRTRLRLLNLLRHGPLCVCHLQAILREPQVKVSKHLRYLKARGIVESRKAGNWRIYRLPARRSPALASNLRCLQDCAAEDAAFRADTAQLKKLRGRWADAAPLRAPLGAKTRSSTSCLC